LSRERSELAFSSPSVLGYKIKNNFGHLFSASTRNTTKEKDKLKEKKSQTRGQQLLHLIVPDIEKNLK